MSEIDDLETDFVHLSQNVQTYNEKESLICLDSIAMPKVSAASRLRITTIATEAALLENNDAKNNDDEEASDEEVTTRSV